LRAKGAALAVAVRCDDRRIYVTYDDGRELSQPLLPFLRDATPKQRRNCRVDVYGTAIYWPDLDEHVGVDWILHVPEDDVLELAGFKTVIFKRS
jgi:hypothetical protein